MIIQFKNEKFEATYDAETYTVGVKNPNSQIAKIIKDDRIQRGLLMGYLLNNPYYNLDECLKNKLL